MRIEKIKVDFVFKNKIPENQSPAFGTPFSKGDLVNLPKIWLSA